MKKIIILVIVLIIVTAVVLILVKKKAKEKLELKTYGGKTRAEFKRDLQKAWKDRFFYTTNKALQTPESWAVDWHEKIEFEITDKGTPRDDAYLQAVQYSWATTQPKAEDNTWSKGWLSEIHVKQELGIDPIPQEIKDLLKEI